MMILTADPIWSDMESAQQAHHFKMAVSPKLPPVGSPKTSPGRSPLSSSRSLSMNSTRFLVRTGSSAAQVGFASARVQKAAEDVLWLASAFFILYYGDFRSNFFSLLVSDSRVRSVPLVYGLSCLAMDVVMLISLFVASQKSLPTSKLMQDHSFMAAASITVIVVGLAAFLMLCMALWPVWHALTIPMLFTLFMASVVVISSLYSASGGCWRWSIARISGDGRLISPAF